jgi:ribosomal protein L16/L10AE
MACGGCGAYKVFWRIWEGGREEKVALVNKKNSDIFNVSHLVSFLTLELESEQGGSIASAQLSSARITRRTGCKWRSHIKNND